MKETNGSNDRRVSTISAAASCIINQSISCVRRYALDSPLFMFAVVPALLKNKPDWQLSMPFVTGSGVRAPQCVLRYLLTLNLRQTTNNVVASSKLVTFK